MTAKRAPATSRHVAEICFFVEPGGFVRVRGNAGEGIYGVMHQLVYRCGSCGEPIKDTEINAHFESHASGARNVLAEATI